MALGVLYAAVLYYRDKTFAGKTPAAQRWQWAMAVFRALAVTVLAVLLLSPFIRHRNTQTFKPIVAVVHDNSESMRNALGKDTTLYREKTEQLVKALSADYQVDEYSAGDRLQKGMGYGFTDKSTNLSQAVDELNSLYYNQNLGAVVLLSDGIYNTGINPVYAANNATYNVYTVAVGDTTIQKDQKVAGAYHNKIAYLNDKFALRVDVAADNLGGKNAVMNVYEVVQGAAPRLLQTKEVVYADDNVYQTYDFVLDADKVGVAHYRISLSNLPGEATYRNNVRDIFVEVLDGRQKILLVANSPHPDIAALRTAIESNKNYQLDVEYAEGFSRKLNEYNLVILHQLPSLNHRIPQLLSEAKAQQKPLLFVVGSQTAITDFTKAQDALTLRGNADKYNDVTALLNKQFGLFTLSDRTMQLLPKLPPLNNFFGDYQPNPTAQILLSQKINSVSTDFPLWMLNDAAGNKTGVIAAEGLWRWRLYDYLMNNNHDATNELINKTVQFLSVKADKRPFRVNVAKSIFQDNEAVTFDAQLYNANYELVNTPEVTLTITGGEEGKKYEYKFNKTEKAYELNAGFLPVGNYVYTAAANMGSGKMTVIGKFSVSPLQLEELRTRADYQTLYQLANQHGGSLHYLPNMEKIAEEIAAKNQLKPVLYDTFMTESAINLKWIFFLLLALISLEWGIRKYLGGY